MTNHLLLFTIGPVQSFIAQARKTQDLFAGSKLLSTLIDFAIGKVKVETINEKGEKVSNIIFPAENISSKPNRFLAIIDDNQIETAKKLACEVQKEFKKIAEGCFKDIYNGKPKPNNFDEQINKFLDINWVILPYEEEKYKETYKEIEKTLGAIKNVRTFDQLKEQGCKCSLCGERNVLFYHPTKGENGSDKKPAHIQEDAVSIKDRKLTVGEGLCAVCFTKRFYTPRHPEHLSCHPEQSEGSKATDSSASPQKCPCQVVNLKFLKKSFKKVISAFFILRTASEKSRPSV